MKDSNDNSPPPRPVGFLHVEHPSLKATLLALELGKIRHDNLDKLKVGTRLLITHFEQKNSELTERHAKGDFHNSTNDDNYVRSSISFIKFSTCLNTIYQPNFVMPRDII